ncbi:hypothetical protein D3C86_1689560 [compost metagenome]
MKRIERRSLGAFHCRPLTPSKLGQDGERNWDETTRRPLGSEHILVRPAQLASRLQYVIWQQRLQPYSSGSVRQAHNQSAVSEAEVRRIVDLPMCSKGTPLNLQMDPAKNISRPQRRAVPRD